MEFEKMKDTIHHRISKPEGTFQRFSILVPIVKVQGELHLLFEVRAAHLRNQPGEICFPGGKIEKNETPEEAALRETSEELNLGIEDLEMIGPLDYVVTPFNTILYPFLGTLLQTNVEEIHFNPSEVGSIFTVPLDFFFNTEPENHFIYINASVHDNFPFHMIQNGKNYKWKVGKYPELFYEYNGHIIWGMTARIVKNLVNILKEEM
ncbi:8-oxo-dGTP pyrophosphatase MutT (NUDIX family) [Anaerosolibacter carboniphilus]|uniref:8-oxo-dGTP pyrophosphatase MutT (NUDIX family) n=1 Tax=Anaerosolibacter carboniphilus TaxID=1417629 RepID=A0A841KLH7_9FIRM|nr:CoA pyrophosphatase [Anaerosolibacter carboniphilus]MBB6214091.1 8-oxo-dGTP pyrophosphatase MutT (NUDIX family) [Anaerosolibacter carboniphilus]